MAEDTARRPAQAKKVTRNPDNNHPPPAATLTSAGVPHSGQERARFHQEGGTGGPTTNEVIRTRNVGPSVLEEHGPGETPRLGATGPDKK